MGYLFGSRNNNCMGTGYNTHTPPRSSFWGGSPGWSNPSTGTGFSRSSSSETRTASGAFSLILFINVFFVHYLTR